MNKTMEDGSNIAQGPESKAKKMFRRRLKKAVSDEDEEDNDNFNQ